MFHIFNYCKIITTRNIACTIKFSPCFSVFVRKIAGKTANSIATMLGKYITHCYVAAMLPSLRVVVVDKGKDHSTLNKKFNFQVILGIV